MFDRPRHFILVPLFSSLLLACSGSTVTGTGEPLHREAGAPTDSEGDQATTTGEGTSSKPPSKKGDGDDPDATAGPVTIKNLSISPSGDGLSLTFALANKAAKSIERVQEITLTVGSGRPVTFAVSCQNLGWLISAGSTSGVIELTLASTTSYASLLYAPSCVSVYADPLTGSGDTISLDMKGLLEDATPWKAQADASL